MPLRPTVPGIAGRATTHRPSRRSQAVTSTRTGPGPTGRTTSAWPDPARTAAAGKPAGAPEQPTHATPTTTTAAIRFTAVPWEKALRKPAPSGVIQDTPRPVRRRLINYPDPARPTTLRGRPPWA